MVNPLLLTCALEQAFSCRWAVLIRGLTSCCGANKCMLASASSSFLNPEGPLSASSATCATSACNSSSRKSLPTGLCKEHKPASQEMESPPSFQSMVAFWHGHQHGLQLEPLLGRTSQPALHAAVVSDACLLHQHPWRHCSPLASQQRSLHSCSAPHRDDAVTPNPVDEPKGSSSSSLPAHIEAQLSAQYQRYCELEQAISQGSGGGAGAEYAALAPMASAYAALMQTREELAGVQQMAVGEADAGLRELAAEEAKQLQAQVAELISQLLSALVPADARDSSAAVLELRAGAGGAEAALFTADLLRMYQQYAQQRGWAWQVVELTANELGGVRSATVIVGSEASSSSHSSSSSSSGGGGGGDGLAGPYGMLRLEAGVHRVQRVPATESQRLLRAFLSVQGRIHTSTAQVVVLPQAGELDVSIKDTDLRVETMRASGAGGQHVNVTDSAVRLTHLPTGLSVACQAERSQHQNRAQAMKLLLSRLFDLEQRKRSQAANAVRSAALGTGERNEKIRTYNFPQGRITDHRIGLTLHGMEAMLDGTLLPDFLQALSEHDRETRLTALLEDEGTS